MRTLLVLLSALPVWAQDPLSLRDAVRLALRENKAVAAAGAGVRAADARQAGARSGMLPRVDYTEDYARSDNPVFVFSSLLTQHRFGAENFNLGPLNRPGALNNFQSLVTVDQALYDGGQTRAAAESAGLARGMSVEEERRIRSGTIAAVARAYYGALLAAENLKTALQAVRSAEADLARAQSVLAAGMSTDVDVLSIRVHLAAVTEQRINRAAELDLARATLNDGLGLPLDTPHALTTPLAARDVPGASLDALEREATGARPEARQTRLAADLARTEAGAAHAAMLPQVGFRGAFEADRQRFITRGGANWMASVSLRWNLFRGFADKARVEETGQLARRASLDAGRTESAVRLEVHRAWSALSAAVQRIEVARAAVTEAEESLRITQNRYAAGMSNVTDLLRTETAVLESRTRHLAAVHDQRVAATMLELATGRLSPESEVLD